MYNYFLKYIEPTFYLLNLLLLTVVMHFLELCSCMQHHSPGVLETALATQFPKHFRLSRLLRTRIIQEKKEYMMKTTFSPSSVHYFHTTIIGMIFCNQYTSTKLKYQNNKNGTKRSPNEGSLSLSFHVLCKHEQSCDEST